MANPHCTLCRTYRMNVLSNVLQICTCKYPLNKCVGEEDWIMIDLKICKSGSSSKSRLQKLDMSSNNNKRKGNFTRSHQLFQNEESC